MGQNDNLVERVHEPAFGPGKSKSPAPAPTPPRKVERPPVKSTPAPAAPKPKK